MSGCCDHGAGLRAGAPSVLGKLPRLTQSSYREAVSQTVSGLAAPEGLTDQDMAELIGNSAASVGNARNKKGDLSAVAMLSIGKAFGPESLNTILALIGAKAVPAGAVCCDNVGHIPLRIAETLPLLITLLSDGECCDGDVRKLEAAGVIDEFIKAANVLERRRNDVRLRAVNS
ncbi:hypothetical protein [Sphingobium sp. RAC03]|uniref:hypothetical protein n=1 Tax=Sphingobium sp. RAC03 TaxID=1843368 RepID=UPI00083DB0EC|nr:hypothetical protein [Sphingobium sp. RAC03]AOF97888.1 hypothetical protein BSY17_2665 [Sphingobium sp. RAC03]